MITNNKLYQSILFLLLSFQVFGQKDSSIYGKWKIVSYSNDEEYINIKNDSVYLKYARDTSEDASEVKKLLTNAKMIFGRMEMQFLNDGTYTQRMDSTWVLSSKFKVIPSKNTIELTDKNSLNQDVTQIMKYFFRDGLLHLSLIWDDASIDLVLERVK